MRQHRTTAMRRAAATTERALRAPAHSAFVLKPIVVQQLLARSNRARRKDEHPTVIEFNGLAIRLATVVDPPGRIAAQSRIDDSAIAELEEQGVIRVRRVARRPRVGERRWQARAAIFDDARALANGSCRECATTVGRRTADRVRRRRLRRGHVNQRLRCARPRWIFARIRLFLLQKSRLQLRTDMGLGRNPAASMQFAELRL